MIYYDCIYIYGMMYRGYSPGCQPLNGLIDRKSDPTETYYDILFYDRRLSDDEIENYELEYIRKEEKVQYG